MDENPGVRMKALEGLSPYSANAQVRNAMSQALLYDSHAGIRTQAIDILNQTQQEDMVGVFQELVQREDNDYIRQRSQNALRAMRASLGTF
jgi:hypothetical protein